MTRRPRTFAVALCALALGSVAACGSNVAVEGGDGGGGGAGGSNTVDCGSPSLSCVWECGSDMLVPAECVGGQWQCPTPSLPIDDCPSGTCWGGPLPCEQCGDGWECHPDASCIGSCDGLVCAECPADPGPSIIAGCSCACDAGGMYGCELAPGCCMQDMDCGDEIYVPCVGNVCKQPVAGGCWKDDECPAGQSCIGADVCPCGWDCDGPDSPGTCS